MKKFLLIGLILLVSFTKTIAQNNFPPVYEITTDTVLIDTLPNPYWQMLEDTKSKLSIDDIINSKASENFHLDTSQKINFHNTVFWFRFTFKNVSNRRLKIGLYDYWKATSDWYIINKVGQVAHKTSGLEIPWSKNESLKFISFFTTSFNFLPLTIEPGDTVKGDYKVDCVNIILESASILKDS